MINVQSNRNLYLSAMGGLRSAAYDFILICELFNAITVLNQFEVLSRKKRTKSMGEHTLSPSPIDTRKKDSNVY